MGNKLLPQIHFFTNIYTKDHSKEVFVVFVFKNLLSIGIKDRQFSGKAPAASRISVHFCIQLHANYNIVITTCVKNITFLLSVFLLQTRSAHRGI